MRLARYLHQGGPHIGIETASGIVPTRWSSFEEIFAEDDPLAAVLASEVDESKAITPDRLLAPCVHRAQVILTGGNYSDHAAEASARLEVSEPVFLAKLSSAIIGPGDDIVIPLAETFADYEVEFSIVIGKKARSLTEANFEEHIFGYTIVNDMSAREVMAREVMQAMMSKSVDTFCPIGPVVVTRDEIADPYALEVSTTVNGIVKQHSTTGHMTARIGELLEHLTRMITLYPGDIMTTGTPGGVGFFRDPPEPLLPGDVVTAEVSQIGKLTNTMRAGY